MDMVKFLDVKILIAHKLLMQVMDIFMVPTEWEALYWNTLEQVKNNQIAMERLNDAVRRILV